MSGLSVAWWALALAILCEVIGTTALKASAGLSAPLPSLIAVLSYGGALYGLAIALTAIPVGIAYAIWAGVGIVVMALVGWLVYRQPLDLAALLGIGLVVAGVVVINVYSRSL